MAAALQAGGDTVELFAGIDSDPGRRPAADAGLLAGMGLDEVEAEALIARGFNANTLQAALARARSPLAKLPLDRIDALAAGAWATPNMVAAHRPRIFNGTVVLFTPTLDDSRADAASAWRRLATDVREHRIAADRWSAMSPDSLTTIAMVFSSPAELPGTDSVRR
jgi:thioesterase domain-containing protein